MTAVAAGGSAVLADCAAVGGNENMQIERKKTMGTVGFILVPSTSVPKEAGF